MQGCDADTWIRVSPNETAGDARAARACFIRGEKGQPWEQGFVLNPIFNSPGMVNLLYLPFNGKKRLRNISVSGVEKGSIGEGCTEILMYK